MKRTALAICLFGFIVTGVMSDSAQSGGEFRWGDLHVTGSTSWGLVAGKPYATGTAVGAVGIHADLKDKGIEVDTKRIVAQIDTKTKLAHSATLSGGVRGTVKAGATGNGQLGEFTGATVVYTNRSDVDPGGSDFDATGGVTFKETLEKSKAHVTLSGSHGVFQMRTIGGNTGLSTADVTGPVNFSVLVDQSGSGGSATSSLSGKADHLTLRRVGADGTDYEIVLSGHVTYNGVMEETPLDGIATTLTVTLDQHFNIIAFNGIGDDGNIKPQGKG